ncbi:cytochrome c biogenesis protein CcmG/thiol:disulfide interchange protein DsbE [Breoghania corrubedonensis]|uniref:Cytochrome c biogenesis protein CcmG/thiol:disulfide interchange protein DsbE n=1 Tax=Breoghania corrubedonensis TaxID=665038 RepID=A0A2T5VIA7_9HYPH|nr:DsbE family thiol:disulfide interchange protein [Breoghania corrubedonensis]PTW63495.1 cytochrome c biogenesis protein CcmG/thiol:disulfide interchange protein DsbE [Breoghania corrubedonensis]
MTDTPSSNDKNAAAGKGAAPETPRRRFPVLVLLPLLIFAGLAALFLIQLTIGRAPNEIPSALINRPAPEFELAPLKGLTANGKQVPGFSTADLIDGNGVGPDLANKVTIVSIFASWCVPCREEHPVLETLAERPDIRLVGINYKDKAENALRFLGALGNPYDAVGVDDKGRAAIDWGVYGVPETFVVDRTGRIRYKFIGPLSPKSLRDVLVPKIEAALAEK